MQRLAALREYEVLDSESEQAFDDLALLAAHICGTPMALVSLVDEQRQWFKARVGLELEETSRDIAFCAHTINGREVMVVEDTHTDDRFDDNPLVAGDPGVRFYAGAPLVTPAGHAVGSLCALDRRPRTLTPEQARALSTLARAVVTQLELRRNTQLLARILQRESETRKESFRMLEALPLGIVVVDSDGQPRYANGVARKTVGCDPPDLIAALSEGVFVAGTREPYPASRSPLALALQGETSSVDDMVVVTEGSDRDLQVWGAPIRDESGTVRSGIVSFVDISERRQFERQLAESEQRYRLLFERNLAGVFVNTFSGRIIDVNEALPSMFGYSRQEVLSLRASDFYVDEQERLEYLKLMESSGAITNFEMRRKRRDGSPFWVLINASLIESESGERLIQGSLLDISARKEVEDRNSYRAHHDPLTGLPNRFLLDDRLEQAIAMAERLDHLVAVCYLDLDRFKQVNDELGHVAGDWLLKEVARRLRGILGATDTIARVGGDEFVIVLPTLHDRSAGEAMAKRIVEALREPFFFNTESELRIGGSVGVAFYPADGDTPAVLLASADEAMYRAKAAGRNAFVMSSNA
jgi:diguanylate cyclase (GGDEF)-like protein/PAS domain S-box-containing protein